MIRVPILMYHRVPRDAAERAELAVPLADFERQLAFIRRAGFDVLSLDALVALLRAGRPPAGPSVVLTFDDGYGATCRHVEERLAAHGFPATLFLTPGLVGTRDPLGAAGEGCLSWEDVKGLTQLDVQAHSLSHPRLSALGGPAIRTEVRGAKAVLEDALGRPVSHFAYPYGGYTRRVVDEVRQAGYASACAVHRGPARQGDLFRLHRVNVDGREPLEVFARKLLTGYASPREQAVCGLRDSFFRLGGVHDLAERWRARHA